MLFYTAERQITEEFIKNFLKEKLPLYMVPTACVQLKSMPLSSNGKVDRNALAKNGD